MLDNIVRCTSLGRTAPDALRGAVEKIFGRIVKLDVAGELIAEYQ